VSYISVFVRVISFCLLCAVSAISIAELNKQQICSKAQLLKQLKKEQCEALVDLYNSTGGDRWRSNEGWGDSNIHNWRAVRVSGGDVEAIWLRGNNLRGELPSSIVNLAMAIVDLSNNDITGTLPPDYFRGMRENSWLVLRHNRMHGNIPPEIIEAPKGAIIDLDHNQFSGVLPAEYYGALERRVDISLVSNNLSGNIPAPPSELPVAREYGLALDLRGNNFSGEIPGKIFELFPMVELSNNNLSGALPESISDFEGREINLSNNNLTSVPAEWGDFNGVHLDLSKNKISGPLPSIKMVAGSFSTIDLSNNKFSGSPVDFVKGIGSIFEIDLSNNHLSGSLKGIEESNVSNLDLSNNQLTELPDDFMGSGFFGINIADNKLRGAVPSIESRSLRRINLSNNQLTGELPLPRRHRYVDIDEYQLSGNSFSGTLSEEFIELFNADIDVSSNRLHGDLESFKRRFDAKNNRASLKIDNQTPYQISVSTQADIQSYQLDRNRGVKFLINLPQGKRIASVSGCAGNLKANVFSVHSGQQACDLNVQLESCHSDAACKTPLGDTQGIANAAIEAPSANEVVSGVVQFRGWLHEPEIRSLKNYSTRNPRGAELLIDGSRIFLDINFDRFDVSKLMGYSETNQSLVGWSALFYAGNLEDGQHTATLVTEEGAIAETVTFNSFTVRDEEGKAVYVTKDDVETRVADFPYVGSELVLRFNPSEQSFSIVDQFNKVGNSTRSELSHYSDDGLQVRVFGPINGVERVVIETPTASSPLLGVASMRGWAYGSTMLNGPLYLAIDDGEQFLVPRGQRKDVEAAMDISTTVKVGWSQLFYTGNLENGRHRLRLFGEEGGERVLLAQSFFESFSPVDEVGNRIYMQGGKSIQLENFPYVGSRVKLSFDPAGQRFVIVSQEVN